MEENVGREQQSEQETVESQSTVGAAGSKGRSVSPPNNSIVPPPVSTVGESWDKLALEDISLADINNRYKGIDLNQKIRMFVRDYLIDNYGEGEDAISLEEEDCLINDLLDKVKAMQEAEQFIEADDEEDLTRSKEKHKKRELSGAQSTLMKGMVIGMQEDSKAINEIADKVDGDYQTNAIVAHVFKKDKTEGKTRANKVAHDLFTPKFLAKLDKGRVVDEGILGKYVDQADANKKVSDRRAVLAENHTSTVVAFEFLMQQKIIAFNKETNPEAKNKIFEEGNLILKDSAEKEHEIKERRIAQGVLEKRLETDGRIPDWFDQLTISVKSYALNILTKITSLGSEKFEKNTDQRGFDYSSDLEGIEGIDGAKGRAVHNFKKNGDSFEVTKAEGGVVEEESFDQEIENIIKEQKNLEEKLGKDESAINLSKTIMGLELTLAIVDKLSDLIGTFMKVLMGMALLIPFLAPICIAFLSMMSVFALYLQIMSVGVGGMLVAAKGMLQALNKNPALYSYLRANTKKSSFELLGKGVEVGVGGGIESAKGESFTDGFSKQEDFNPYAEEHVNKEDEEIEEERESIPENHAKDVIVGTASEIPADIAEQVYDDELSEVSDGEANDKIFELKKEAFEAYARQYAKNKTSLKAVSTDDKENKDIPEQKGKDDEVDKGTSTLKTIKKGLKAGREVMDTVQK